MHMDSAKKITLNQTMNTKNGTKLQILIPFCDDLFYREIEITSRANF